MNLNASWLLRLLLWANGLVMLLALAAVVMPTSWMAAAHEWLGLGPFPGGPVVIYLARSVSLLYAALGGLLLLLAGDLRRYGPIIAYAGLSLVGLGAVVLIVGLLIGLPAAWIAAEGPLTIADGIAVLALRALAKGQD